MLLGIDIGGTKTAFAIAHPGGHALQAHTRHPAPKTGDARADVDRIVEQADALLAQAGLGRGDVSVVGLSVPGPLDLEAGQVIRPPNLPGWEAVPIREWLAEAFDCPVALENDANAAALAEWRKGAGEGTRDLVYLTMSTGVGGGIVLGGRLHRGRLGTAGELGHVPVVVGGELCACGLRGCLEAYVGGAAWTKRLRSTTPASSRVAELAGDVGQITTRHLLEAAREGDAFALAEVDGFNRHLAQAIAWLTFALAPEVVVLGTIVVAGGRELMLDPIRALVRESVWPHQAPYMRIEAARLGEHLAEWAGVCAALEFVQEATRPEPAS
jgi:glucokinase